MTAVTNEEKKIMSTEKGNEKPGLFKRASEGVTEFASNRPVTTAFIAMASYDVGKAVVKGPIKTGAKFVGEKVGGMLGRRAATATVDATAHQTAHLIGGIVKSVF